MGRSKLKTLKETTLATFNDLVSQLGIRDQFKYNDNKGVITHKNGSEIILKDLFLYPADPNFDSLGSLEITGAFIDECNQITYKAWQVVKSRIRFKLKENNLTPKILGSCNPAKNWVYSKFYLPSRNKELPHYMKFIQALPTDNPHLPKSYLEALLQLDENSRQRLYYGNWEYDNDPSALMSMQNIWAIFNNESVTTGDKFITADIARFGRDKTVIMAWDGFRCEYIQTIDKNKITEAVDAINAVAKRFNVPLSNIIVDSDGVGGGAVDSLDCEGFVNNGRPLPNPTTGDDENFQNLKSQMYFKLAEMINKGEIYVNCEDGSVQDYITKELEQVKQYEMDKDGKRRVMPKDKIKELIGRSPDYSDCLMMRMWFLYRKQKNVWFGWD